MNNKKIKLINFKIFFKKNWQIKTMKIMQIMILKQIVKINFEIFLELS